MNERVRMISMFDLSTSVGDDSPHYLLYIVPYDYLCNEMSMDHVHVNVQNTCIPSEFML